MNSPFYAMDTNFYSSIGAYPFEARCEMLRELGYDAAYLTLWDEASWRALSKLPQVQERYGLEVAAVYATLTLTEQEEHEGNMRILRMLEELEGCRTVEIAITGDGQSVSDPACDPLAIKWLDRLLAMAESRDLQLLLYPHVGFWLERIEDAVRLCEQKKHPRLNCIFTSYHWYIVDGQDLEAKLRLAIPYLRAVNICGSRRSPDKMSGLAASIEPLDSGEMDLFVLLAWLKKLGFDGPVGLQGYASGGDVYAKLKRSIAAYRDLKERVERASHWAELDPKQPWM